MQKLVITAAVLAAITFAVPANANERTLTGAAIGAGAGALVLGPVGAVAGGAIGAWVGGPRISRTTARKRCWRDDAGVKHCHWR